MRQVDLPQIGPSVREEEGNEVHEHPQICGAA